MQQKSVEIKRVPHTSSSVGGGDALSKKELVEKPDRVVKHVYGVYEAAKIET
jgi:hypothetical protein